MEKRFFPGIDTLAKRKRFAVFHGCTFVISPLIVAIIMFLVNLMRTVTGMMPVQNSITMNPLSNIWNWMIWSLFAWNAMGSIRFHDDAFDSSSEFGWLYGRITALVFLFIFPFYYLHNLWCVIREKGTQDEGSGNLS